MADDLELLGQFAREESNDAFTTLVQRHLDLVYSAALRQVRSPQLAEEVAQSVFTNLARNAAKLRPDTILTAWLYQVTRNIAIDTVRREARRQAREQIALQMSESNAPPPDWMQIEPLLDEAMNSLEEADRAAILLRYFQNKSLREVGEALGASEDAAQKRVSRALERLREYYGKRRVAFTAVGLAALVSAHAVQAAPVALAQTISSGAVLAAGTVSTPSALFTTKTLVLAMTTTQKAILAVVLLGAAAGGIYYHQSQMAEQATALQLEKQKVAELTQQRDTAKADAQRLTTENQSLQKRPSEVVKLRGEVGQLRGANETLGSKNAISKVTANPEVRKLMRDQQKVGLAAIFKGFAEQAKLTPENTGKLNDLMADLIMDNVDSITTILRDKTPADQVSQIFAAQQAAFESKVSDLLGADGATQFDTYSHNLLSTLTSEQFKDQLTGTDAEKAAKAQQLSQLTQQVATSAMASANLPANYQAVPMLNLENIASEQKADVSLNLLSNIYQQVGAGASAFLSPEEVTKFQQFSGTAITNSRAALSMNRTLMAPIGN